MNKKIIGIVTLMLLVVFVFNKVYANECKYENKDFFKDIKSTDWFYKEVYRLSDKELVKGYEDNTYRPYGKLRYDEFVVLVLRALNKENQVLINKDEYWSKSYMKYAIKIGLIEEKELLKYNLYVSREEMSKIICKALKINKEESILKSVDDRNKVMDIINDSDKIEFEYKSEVAEVYTKGILVGYEDDTFRPNIVLNRAEAAVIILRLIDEEQRKPLDLKKIVEIKENKLPKNYKDYYSINSNIPKELYEYSYNKMIKYPDHVFVGNQEISIEENDAFMNNKKLSEEPFNTTYQCTGLEVTEKIQKYANGILDACYNMDYTKDKDEIRDKIRYYLRDSYFMSKYIDNYVEKIIESGVKSKYEFLTDKTLVYQDYDGNLRIRGRFKIMYISNKNKKCITFENNNKYNEMYMMPIELNKWYERDIEISFSRSFGNGLWKRVDWTSNIEITFN